jgi:uroporphyrin-III C-methyltransferase/precorrin-2 dehydrogenase/sirohydrochlorin ferrochelatase
MTCLDTPARITAASQPRPKGRISLVGAGPGAADLLTLRALRCLGRADAVFYDRLVDPDLLDLARPGARRVFVGKETGAHPWPQARIDAAIVSAALQGDHVVRLKSGDPSVFGRAAEEIAAARAHGIEVEIIPGITAASAAAACLGQPLTARGETDRVVLATATCQPGDPPPPVAELALPGTTLVFYMAMHRLDDLARGLIRAGLAPDQPVAVAANVSKPGQTCLHTTLARMQPDCRAAAISNPAVILIPIAKAPPPAAARPARHRDTAPALP